MKLPMQIFIALGLAIKRNIHIFLGIILGIIFGVIMHSYMPQSALEQNSVGAIIYNILNLIGQIFLRLIQMVVIPLVFSAIIIGISSIGDNKQLGKFGGKMVFYYAIITVIAVILGAGLATGLKPGEGVQSYISEQSQIELQKSFNHIDTTNTENINIVNIIPDNPIKSFAQGDMDAIITSIIPDNPIKALAQGNMIAIILFVSIFAIALAKVGEINRPVVSFFESLFAATMKVIDWIMYFAAPGIFALVATSVSQFGLSMFGALSKYFLAIFLGFAIQLFILYPLMLKIFSKVPILSFYSAIAEAMMVAFGTASSSATLPLTMACCEKRGISHKICSFVLPLGATLNMDASALFQVVSVIFLTQAYDLHLSIFQIILVMILAIIASSTSAGIPSAGLITIVLILQGLGLEASQLVQGFAFLFAVERIIDMFRTMNNVTSDAVVATLIADNENEINYDLLSNPDSNEII